jgi:hypothetical protein
MSLLAALIGCATSTLSSRFEIAQHAVFGVIRGSPPH